MRILDTDHVSLLERKEPLVVETFNRFLPEETAITVITWEEQMRGRLNVIRQAKTSEQRIIGYTRLCSTINFLSAFRVVNFDQIADSYYQELRHQKIRIGTQDLLIASVVLSIGATLITRNQRDFGKVPGLILEDWSIV
jgi:tRNA(fMet)-specific endonuclease VapC